jgi:hypothetical protein
MFGQNEESDASILCHVSRVRNRPSYVVFLAYLRFSRFFGLFGYKASTSEADCPVKCPCTSISPGSSLAREMFSLSYFIGPSLDCWRSKVGGWRHALRALEARGWRLEAENRGSCLKPRAKRS